MKIKYSLAAFLAMTSLNAEDIDLGSVSVTATKVETATKEISQSIAVINAQEVEDKNILNIQEAIENIPGVNAESSTNSPSPRLIIRGAGLKARYGVREIMVMKDGVPMTDPDSFTRFDFIDMQDVESLEVQKGPGSINAVNAVGGVIQLRTKSVFKKAKDRIKLGLGNDGQYNVNLKVSGKLGENDFVSTTLSSRAIDNGWRDHNDFDSTQFTQKYGHIFKDDSTIETELSYTESNMNIPASMNASEFETFKQTGEQHDTNSSIWQNSARDSKILAFNAKYEKEIGNLTLKPRFYFNTWDHFHPVSGIINDSTNNNVFGTDLEFDYNHKLFDNKAILVAGVTAKTDITKDAKKYEYADVATSSGKIISTLSNTKGTLAEVQDSTTSLYGIYLAETFSPTQKLTFDVSTRIDKLTYDLSGNEITKFNYSTGGPTALRYVTGDGLYSVNKAYDLLSLKFGSTYKLTKSTNIYASVAQANQAPTTSELGENINLNKAVSTNYEIGLKTRTKKITSDIAIYQNDVTDEIIQATDSAGQIIYDNAGKTQKRGLEINTVYSVSKPLKIGASYAYSDFKFATFSEKVYIMGSPVLQSRDGNYLNYIPKNQYSLFAALKMGNGFKARVTTKSWGSYYTNFSNTEKYEGFDFVTNLMVGYETKDKKHSVQLNVKNITNQYYAMEASSDFDGSDDTYKAAAPISAMLTYQYQF